ncbi:MAG: Smr/MutS family protein [Ideonella sp.]|nr:Smr/MutS family protein [Ideonella sp.]MBL0148322.1 Smr/MutS family protein [Ideonella sp.]
MKLRSLGDLGQLWQHVREVARHAEREALLQAQREREQRRRQEAQHNLFARTVGRVHPMPDRGLAELKLPLPAPHPRQRELDEQAAVRASMTDEVTLESLLLTDDGLSFRRPGIGPDVLTRLRRGDWTLQGEIDLHGLKREEARDALADFVRDAHLRGMRCVRVVHGKGHGSPGKQAVLKTKVQHWLAQRAEVLAFAQATGPQGGAGALVVLLQRQTR